MILIGHNFAVMLSIVNRITLQNELHKKMLIIFFGQKIKTKQQQNKRANIKILAKTGKLTATETTKPID